MKKKQRNSNLELLRIISMFLVVLGHFAWQTNWSVNNDTSLIRLGAIHCLWIGGKLGVNLFILISGYFLINSKFKLKSFFNVWLTAYVYGWAIFILYSLFVFHGVSIKIFIKTLFMGSAGYLNWFVTAYLVMYVLHPFVNKMLDALSRREFLILVLLGFLVFSIFKTVFNNPSIGSGGDDAVWLIFVYIVGAFIRKNEDIILKVKSKRIVFISIVSFLLSVLSIFSLDYVNIAFDLSKSNRFYGKFVGGTSPLQLITAICIFILFIKFAPHYNTLINNIAKTTFAIYLIHANTIIVNWLWHDVVAGQRFENTYFVFVYALLVAVLIFTICSVIEMLREKLLGKLHTKVTEFLTTKSLKLYNYMISRFKKILRNSI